MTAGTFWADLAGARFIGALTGAACVFYTVLLTARLTGKIWIGLAAGLWLLFQKHFLLYSRMAVLDVPLTLAYLGSLYHFLKVTEYQASPRIHLAASGLWLVVAVWTKSWFAFALLPALWLAWVAFYRQQINLKFMLGWFAFAPLLGLLFGCFCL
jgi:4-amino-4-deoxy-L-arabinose transferase-like glycosyltransferase